jgi:Zn-dependent M28 family amino/carboxypeptidase
MLSEKFAPRNYKHPENLDRAAAYIRREFENTDGRISEQAYRVDSLAYRNVILELGPQTQERIVIGAHYDVAGEFPGSDDNASGIAGLIELARLLNRAPLPLTVELVAYTFEEPPFFRTNQMGSNIHAKQLKEQGIRLRMMISLEMIGYFSDDANSQRFPLAILKLFYPTEGNWLAVIGDMGSVAEVRRVKASMQGTTALPVYSFNAPPSLVAGIDWSDHLNYRNNNYPGIMLTDTAFLRNLNYHTEHDTPDLLDYNRMAMVVVGVYAAVLDTAQE